MEQVAVVTGASAGIGEAIAQDLLAQGRTVLTLQRRPPRIKHPQLLFEAVDLGRCCCDGGGGAGGPRVSGALSGQQRGREQTGIVGASDVG